ncbi:hypothetical protein [Bdellovibrio sp. KM01]|uniref:hypothetical protein n=1 Tax=Bdellovibrio sp. KM01 TaxID=2748865 RepID=UPI0015EAABE1|nr:hypothetical protein [Bdellovibrio sp. KM01]QLY23923.1 hypothetical protein HW988_10550 [Bdellovibrio sp. KM01]
MKITAFVLSMLFVGAVWAQPASQADFSRINFVGVEVLSASGDNAFPWAVKPMVNGWEDLLKKLEDVSSTKIVSPIFYLAEKTSFKNIFVFVGKGSDGTFQFVNIYYTMAGAMYPSNMKIMNVEHDHLDVAQGIPNEQPKDFYKVTAKQLFP